MINDRPWEIKMPVETKDRLLKHMPNYNEIAQLLEFAYRDGWLDGRQDLIKIARKIVDKPEPDK